jgi:DNA-binding IclR family transcriptional regulator
MTKEKETYHLDIVDTIEHEDGSATYQFQTSEEAKQMFAELGMRLVLHCAASGKSTEEVLENVLQDIETPSPMSNPGDKDYEV